MILSCEISKLAFSMIKLWLPYWHLERGQKHSKKNVHFFVEEGFRNAEGLLNAEAF